MRTRMVRNSRASHPGALSSLDFANEDLRKHLPAATPSPPHPSTSEKSLLVFLKCIPF